MAGMEVAGPRAGSPSGCGCGSAALGGQPTTQPVGGGRAESEGQPSRGHRSQAQEARHKSGSQRGCPWHPRGLGAIGWPAWGKVGAWHPLGDSLRSSQRSPTLPDGRTEGGPRGLVLLHLIELFGVRQEGLTGGGLREVGMTLCGLRTLGDS